MKVRIVAFVYLCLPCAAAIAHTPDFILFEKQIRAIKNKLDMPSGAAVAVVEGDRLVYEGYFGLANIEESIRVDENTHFYIASTTKAFFALATLLAEHKGDLKDSTTLRKLFPETRFTDVDPDAITVRHLLTHTSGLDQKAFTWAGSYSGQHDAALRRKFVASVHPDEHAQLGEHRYTNLGYNVMSVWFEDFYDRDWRLVLDEFVLDPIGMNDTSGFMSDVEKLDWDYAQPYSFKYADGKKQVYLKKDDDTMYSIGLVSTARDVARFLLVQLNDGAIDGRRVFPAEVIKKARARQVDVDSYYDGYAWGWQLGRYKGAEEVFHTGGFVGASALISYLPERDVGLVILQNESGLKANHLADIVKGMAYDTVLGVNEEEMRSQLIPRVEELTRSVRAARISLAETKAEKAKAPWNLSAAKSEYAGTYTHKLAGEIIVDHDESDGLTVAWGNLRGKTFGHPDKDNVFVSFRPAEYEVLGFRRKGSTIEVLTINDHVFRRR